MNKENPIKIKISREPERKEELVSQFQNEELSGRKSVSQNNFKERFFSDPFGKIARMCLYFLVFVIPIFFLPFTVAPLQINKQILIIILVLIAFICYLIRSIYLRQIIYPKSLLSLSVLTVWAIVGISAILSKSLWIGIFGDFVQVDGFLCFSIYALIFFLATVFLKKEDLFKIGFYFFLGLILALIFGLLQIFGKFILPWDFSKQTNFNSVGSLFDWGIFIVFGLTMIIVVLTTLKLSRNFKIILSLVALLIFIALVILNFKLLWIGLALTMFLLALIKFMDRRKIILPLILIIISIFLVLVGSRLPSLINVPAEARPNLSSTLSTDGKVFVGNFALKQILSVTKQILLGSGPATFSYDFARFRPQIVNQTVFWQAKFNQGFSFLFTLLATIGIAGALVFLFLIFSFVRYSLKLLSFSSLLSSPPDGEGREELKREEKNSLVIIIGLSFLIICLFIYPASFTQLFFIFLGFGLLMLELESIKTFEIDFYKGNKWQRIREIVIFLIAILLLSFVLFMFYLVIQKYSAAVYYRKGFISQTLDKSLANFNKAAKLDSQSDQYLRTLSQALILKSGEITQTSVLAPQEKIQDLRNQLQNTIVSAMNNGRQAVALNPLDASNWSNLANIYEKIIPTKDADIFAEQNYKKAMELEPQNPQGPVDLARVLIISADQKNAGWEEKLKMAKNNLEQSIKLKSDYAPAHFLMAQLYIKEGDLIKAIGKVEEIKRMNPGDAGLALQLGILFQRNNQIEQAQSEFERAVALNENYSNARYFLGLIYDQKNQKEKAIEQFEKIKKFNPDNQEIKKILSNLKSGKSALEGIVPPAQPPAERAETPLKDEKKKQ